MDADMNSIIENSEKYRTCISLFGQDRGKKLFGVIQKIYEKGFRATATDKDDEIIIARNHSSKEKISRIANNDYDLLILPDNQIRRISELSYTDITRQLDN